ncbi:MAG: hypothetical protein LBQ84_08515 [Flavobacteriaceae bacterium]|jgi:hypothetical protein|nr:hypothetical protein [Flavobacteriaceae bacterium]
MNTQPIIKLSFIVSFLIIPAIGFSQIREEVLNAGKKKNPEVNVKNIEKKKSNPDRYPPAEEASKKESDTLNYTITDVPAASEFQTSQLPPQPLNTDFKESYYNNYAKIGYGTQNTLLGDAYFSYPVDNNLMGIKFSALSTDGPKSKYDWKTFSSNIDAEAFYILKLKTGKLHLATNYIYDRSNYYGLNIPELYATPNINLEQNTQKITFKSDYDLYSNNYLDKASLKAGYWWDKFNSKESFIDVKAKLAKSDENASMMLSGLNFGAEADVLFNYTYTQFGLDTENKYSHITTGFSPVLKISNRGSYLKVGVNIAYNLETEENNSKFFFHPKAEFLFYPVPEFSLYAGVDGGLKLNNISELSIDNPYLFSNQILRPTNTLYNIYAGIKGDISENIKYEAEASFSKAENLLIYMRNSHEILTIPFYLKPYNRLNTFNAVYDDGNIINIKGALHYFWNGDLNLALEGEYNHYDLDNLINAYHLPGFKIGLNGNYKMLDDKLKLGAKLFFAGERKSNYFYYDSDNSSIYEGLTSLSSYFDLNLSASYQLMDRLSIFLNGNNLFGKNYERFQGYKVNGTQVLAGVFVKF